MACTMYTVGSEANTVLAPGAPSRPSQLRAPLGLGECEGTPLFLGDPFPYLSSYES